MLSEDVERSVSSDEVSVGGVCLPGVEETVGPSTNSSAGECRCNSCLHARSDASELSCLSVKIGC